MRRVEQNGASSGTVPSAGWTLRLPLCDPMDCSLGLHVVAMTPWTVAKIARRNINNFRYTDDTTFMAESEEELKRS